MPTPTATVEATPNPPRLGSFDVYLGAPDEDGRQKVQWIEEESGVAVTEVTIRAQDKQAVRAGQYIYFVAAGTNHLMRINTGGGMQVVSFASPPPDAAFYDFALSANGNFLAWAIVNPSGEYSLHFSDSEGALNRVLISGTAAVGDQLHVLRVSNDGRKVFYDYRPTTITHQSLFRGMYNLSVIDVATGQSTPLPGEPACGEIFVCDAHISPDGAFLIRTLPPARFRQPIK
ncbi:MAG: hypothetical protein L0219_22480, partial [Phycisphaerales bacterium]|nr:hypothetical protein [Phycisphaerales bacterium]